MQHSQYAYSLIEDLASRLTANLDERSFDVDTISLGHTSGVVRTRPLQTNDEVIHDLLFPSSAQRVVELNQGYTFIQLCLSKGQLGVEVTRVTI
jgi:hypothetical protein